MAQVLKTILILLFPTFLFGQIEFIENLGQWEEPIHYKMQLKYGALFFEKDGLKVHLLNTADMDARFSEENHQEHKNSADLLRHHAYKQNWLGSQFNSIIPHNKKEHYNNYFKGSDPKRWRGNVGIYTGLRYVDVYPGIDLEYKNKDNRLKYNWIVGPGANPKAIQWNYTGADSVWISQNKIIISTSVGFVTEELPEVYTINNGIKSFVDATFQINNKVLSFKIDQYDSKDTLIIDPVVVFASFSGSMADNWGFTATYDEQGHLFGGGIVLSTGYPVTTGAFQSTHANPSNVTPITTIYGIDCGITKFNSQGNNLLYSTYLGGNSQDQPHSMYTDDSGNLYVFGVTGSSNFPVSSSAFQSTFNGGDSIYLNGYHFNNGADMFVVKFNAAGTALLAGTYIGGTGNDGLNMDIVANYADQSRGEIVLDDLNQVYITASTKSGDFPIKNASQSTMGGKQDAVVMKLNSNLSNLFWSTYYGGIESDAGYGIKVGSNGSVYICGGTEGSTLGLTNGTINPSYMGGTRDGFIAKFNQSTGALQASTYIGTSTYDQTFLIDLDKFNNVYVFGQTLGNYPTTSGVYFNQNGREFIHKVDGNLINTIFTTKIGRGAVNIDLVPTAFNVDDCLNILLSGWGGTTNGGSYLGGNVTNMPITPDAFQSTTDGSDFYFMVLEPNAQSLEYASYFGGNVSAEHVDGGTSRFDKHGNIYQAVCAGCGGYSDLPTTPGAWSQSNNSLTPSSNCNLGVIKINFETSINANGILDTTIALDTSCNTLTATFLNLSTNANFYLWDFGNGKTSNAPNPTVSFDTLGNYTIKLVAYDTICDIKDSITFTLNHDKGIKPVADFDVDYTSCDVFKTVSITNNTINANAYYWDFDDGNFSSDIAPIHSYVNDGIYTIMLIATDTTCGAADTAFVSVDFTNNIPPPEIIIKPDSCFYGGINVEFKNDSSWYLYEWNFGGYIDRHKHPLFRYKASGRYEFSLTITDTICNVEYTYSFNLDFIRIEDRIFIPNAFTPNRDATNEKLIIAGNNCIENPRFQIFDSWGNLIFETDHPFSEFWDGYINGKPAQEDVYVYFFKSDTFEKRGYVTVFY